MTILGVNCSVPDFSKVNIDEVLGKLHEHAQEIADTILAQIEGRTPVDTGALQEDETYRLGASKSTLVTWYVGEDYQLAEWNRVYAPYQEGPPLGKTTDTNGPHQMFALVATDDLPLIQSWADAAVAEALDGMTAEANAGTTTEVFS